MESKSFFFRGSIEPITGDWWKVSRNQQEVRQLLMVNLGMKSLPTYLGFAFCHHGYVLLKTIAIQAIHFNRRLSTDDKLR